MSTDEDRCREMILRIVQIAIEYGVLWEHLDIERSRINTMLLLSLSAAPGAALGRMALQVSGDLGEQSEFITRKLTAMKANMEDAALHETARLRTQHPLPPPEERH